MIGRHLDAPDAGPAVCEINGVTVDLAAERLLDRAGREVPLRAQSFAVLRHLAANPGRVIAKDELIEKVWRGVAVTDDSLVQCVMDIRRALGDDAQAVIRTVQRRGYRLVPPDDAFPARLGPASPWPIAAAIALACLVAAVIWQTARPAPPAAVTDAPVVAVLPFEILSPDPTLAYLGRGVADDVIAMLARAPDMAVVSALSAFPFGSAPVDLRAVGAGLGADYLLLGGVQREGERLRLTAQLVDAATGRHLWAERFDEAGVDPLALQDAVADRVVGALTGERGRVVRSEYRSAWGKDAASLGEYDYYLRGHDLFIRLESRATNDAAGRIWREGFAKYPESALLEVKLGWFHYLAASYVWSDDPAADLAAAERIAREVLAEADLTPQVRRFSQWLLASVLTQRGDVGAALAAARRAVEMAPNDAFVLWALADSLAFAGETEQSAAWLARAAALDPGQHALHRPTRGFILYVQGRYEDALAEFAAAGPLLPVYETVRAIALMRLGRTEAAEAAVRSARDASPTLSLATWRDISGNPDPGFVEAELADLAAAGLPK